MSTGFSRLRRQWERVDPSARELWSLDWPVRVRSVWGPLRLTGAAAGSNPFRFSTKRTEDGTGLVLYEYRAYNPALGRWLSRDPILETAFRSLLGDDDDETGMNRGLVEGEYCFVRNRAVLVLGQPCIARWVVV